VLIDREGNAEIGRVWRGIVWETRGAETLKIVKEI